MKRFLFFALLIVVLYQNHSCSFDNCALTFKTGSGSRFGDCLVVYTKAKWIAYHYTIPFLFQPFSHSSTIMAHQLEKKVSDSKLTFKKIMRVRSYDSIEPQAEPTLFVTYLNTKVPNIDVYEKIINDQSFGNEIKKMLQPAVAIRYVPLPTNKITVAVHIRKGSWVDKPLYSLQQFDGHQHLVQYAEHMLERNVYSDVRWPTKFPPEQFYIDQLKKLSALFEHKPMYVYIFTDYAQPDVLVKKMKTAVGLSNIEYTSHHKHLYKNTFVDDFYNMARFDCLIRPASGFSRACQLFGDHKVIIYPTKAKWLGKKVVMNQVTVIKTSTRTTKKIKEKKQYLY